MSIQRSDLVCLSTVCPDLERIRSENTIPELNLITSNGEEVAAHRIILAARLPYFRNLRLGEMRENNMSVNLDIHPKEYVEAIVKYAYTGQLTISDSNVKGLLHLALCLKINSVENWCTEFVIPTVNRDNFEGWMTFAIDNNCSGLQTTCIYHMQKNFEAVVSNDSFTALPVEHFLNLLRSDDLVVSKEESVVHAIEKWAVAKNGDSDETKRFLHVPDLLNAVRWNFTSRDFRVETLARRTSLFCEETFREILLQIDKQLSNPISSSSSTVDFNSSPRKCKEIEDKKLEQERQNKRERDERERERRQRDERERRQRDERERERERRQREYREKDEPLRIREEKLQELMKKYHPSIYLALSPRDLGELGRIKEEREKLKREYME